MWSVADIPLVGPMGTRVMKGRNCLTVIMDVLCVVTFLPANMAFLRDRV